MLHRFPWWHLLLCTWFLLLVSLICRPAGGKLSLFLRSVLKNVCAEEAFLLMLTVAVILPSLNKVFKKRENLQPTKPHQSLQAQQPPQHRLQEGVRDCTAAKCAEVTGPLLRPSKTQQDPARTSQTQQGPARPSKAQQNPARPGKAQQESGKELENDPLLTPIFKYLHEGRLKEAITRLSHLPGDKVEAVSDRLTPKLLTAAAAASDKYGAASLVQGAIGSIGPKMLELAMMEAYHKGNARLCLNLNCLARFLSIPRSDITFASVAWAYAGDTKVLRRLMQQASVPLSMVFAKAILKACAATDVELAAEVYERADPADVHALHCYAGQIARHAKLADPYMSAINIIQERGQAKDLEGAIAEFKRHPLVTGQVHGHMGEKLLQSIVQACISCGDWDMAKKQIQKARQQGIYLRVSNLLIATLLEANDLSSAELLLRDSSELRFHISQSCYHRVIQSYVLADDCESVWRVVAYMQSAGWLQNHVTCSILLKMVASPAHATDLSKIIHLAENMTIPADDELLCKITEACLKAGRLDFLSHDTPLGLSKIGRCDGPTLSEQLYGAMITAFGQAGEVDRVWALWGEMRSRDVQPSNTTLSKTTLCCMVESLVANSEFEAAWKLLHEIWQDQDRWQLVTTFPYGMLMKGGESSATTMNTASDMFEAIYLEMREERIKSNYNTLIIGFCAVGNIVRALELQKEMHGKFKPEQMMYNSLLDRCASAKRPRLPDALRLVDEMKKSNRVKLSNYTQHMLVKILGRCKLLDQALSVVDEFKADFGLSPNMQVYNCLMQSCFHNRQPAKALSLLDRISEYGLCPDRKTYGVLVEGHLRMGMLDEAIKLVQRACQGESPVGVDSHCLEDVIARLLVPAPGRDCPGAGHSAMATALRKQVEEAWHRDEFHVVKEQR